MGYKYYCEQSEQKKIWGCIPYDILRGQQLQRHTESLSDSVSQEYMLATIFLTGQSVVMHL